MPPWNVLSATLSDLQGKLNEFRIYDRALSEEEARNSYAAGPDAGESTVQAPQIGIAIDANGNVVLTFEGTLRSADAVIGPFAEVPGAASPLIVAPSSTSQFFPFPYFAGSPH